ncbi:MAG: Coenzyme F420:L-glutamate ligase [Promethearchaeota archaeon]|nr:MAG: Coenzyme F420:L-glutamate ligase [Candidatus Lokiarchaeota archaeon]
MKNRIELIGLENIPKIKKGDSIPHIISKSLKDLDLELQDGDILLIAQSIISKSLGRVRDLTKIKPSKKAMKLYHQMKKEAIKESIPEKSPELIELILKESEEILQSEHVFIVETKYGFICANAGIDKSNIEGKNSVTLLPEDPDLEARNIREELEKQSKKEIAVIITDSFGRPFRIGSVGVAIGISGISALLDRRGGYDLYGKELQTTIVGHVDNLASAAQLMMGEGDEGLPIVLLRGYEFEKEEGISIQSIFREKETDLFRMTQKNLIESALRERRSYKLTFGDRNVDKELIKKCINLSRWAPSAHNKQQWRYIILGKEKIRQDLIDEMNEKLKEDLREDGKSEDFIQRKIEKTRSNFLKAPYLILLCLDEEDLESYGDQERDENEFIMGIQSVSASATYLLLAFEAYELAACWYCAPLFAKGLIKKVLNLPNSFVPMAFFTVGHPLNIQKAPNRKDLDQIIYDIKE